MILFYQPADALLTLRFCAALLLLCWWRYRALWPRWLPWLALGAIVLAMAVNGFAKDARVGRGTVTMKVVQQGKETYLVPYLPPMLKVKQELGMPPKGSQVIECEIHMRSARATLEDGSKTELIGTVFVCEGKNSRFAVVGLDLYTN
jgi:hypothetical protein